MKLIKLYSFCTIIDFGQCKGETVEDVFEKSPSYINWCFQKVDWFCITDDVFEKLPIVIFLKKDNNPENRRWLKELHSIHNYKKENYQNTIK